MARGVQTRGPMRLWGRCVVAALGAGFSLLTGCKDAGCIDEPSQSHVVLSDLRNQTLVLREDEAALFVDDGHTEVCPMLVGPIESSPGSSIKSSGGSYCGSHDVGVKKGCQSITLDLPRAADDGLMTLDVHDDTHHIVVQAVVPDTAWSLSGSGGRVRVHAIGRCGLSHTL